MSFKLTPLSVSQEKIDFKHIKEHLLSCDERFENWLPLLLQMFNFEAGSLDKLGYDKPAIGLGVWSNNDLEFYKTSLQYFQIQKSDFDIKFQKYSNLFDEILERINSPSLVIKSYIDNLEFAILAEEKICNAYKNTEDRINMMVCDYFEKFTSTNRNSSKGETQEAYQKRYIQECKSFITPFLFQPPEILVSKNDEHKSILQRLLKRWNPEYFVKQFNDKLDVAFKK